MLLHRSFGLIALAVVVSACAAPPADTTNDPRGTDATFHFSWRINGQDPTDASDPCAAAGIRFIRMNIVASDDSTHPVDAFSFDCHLASYTSAHPELRAGTYRLFWEALAPDGTRRSIAAGTLENGQVSASLEPITVPANGQVDFDASNRPDTTFPPAPTNFATGQGPLRATFAWAAHAGDTTGPDCLHANVATVSWTLRRSNGAASDIHATPSACSDGFNVVQWDALDFDRYTLELHGFDATGTERYRGHCVDLAVSTPGPTPTRVTCVADPLP